jgi:hypothetical protein
MSRLDPSDLRRLSSLEAYAHIHSSFSIPIDLGSRKWETYRPLER